MSFLNFNFTIYNFNFNLLLVPFDCLNIIKQQLVNCVVNVCFIQLINEKEIETLMFASSINYHNYFFKMIIVLIYSFCKKSSHYSRIVFESSSPNWPKI